MDNIKQLHEQFRKKERKRTWITHILQLCILTLFFVLWEIASNQDWIDPLLFSSPSNIWELFLNKWIDGSLWVHIWTTLLETGVGFILGTVLGTIIATILWWIPLVARVLDPYLVVLNAMPKVALGPIIIVIFGPNITSSIAMGVIISIIITILVIYSAFQEVDANYIKVMHTFGANKWQTYQQVILPASFPTIISTLKVNVGLSWVGVIFGELLVSKQGLGYLISYGFQVFNFTLILLSVLLTCVLATLMYVFVEGFEKLIIRKRKRS
ncbi:ABC transporter permease [Bacillus cytotoxicus]|uniref:ABC transporter permease n=1 Tax=Bacillus cereus group sp. BfR-BA-01492 TaxID=2920361 RepID=UPI001F55DBDD|nr:ABC transporter permease [Bacillus cereus group sp. BfR-BA-01492]EMA6344651.1 ABC transporter permease [Bacillus cytotoxicus]